MATRHDEAKVRARSEILTPVTREDDGRSTGPRLTGEDVWRALDKASFAVLGYVTPAGEPRSSGVVYKTVGRRLYVAVAPDSWKAKHIAASRQGRGDGAGAPGRDPVAPGADPARNDQLPRDGDRAPGRLATGSLAVEGAGFPAPGRAAEPPPAIIEIVPEGAFVTYGLGVSVDRRCATRPPLGHACP